MKLGKKKNLELNNDLILNLFVSIIANTSIIIAVVQVLRSNKSEAWDRTIFILAILSGFYSLFAFLLLDKKNVNKFYVVISSIILSVGIYGIEKHGTETTRGVDVSNLLWLGYGPWVLLTTLLISPIVFSIYNWAGLNLRIRVLLNLLAMFVAILVIPALWQGGRSIIDRDSTEYVINENLAVPAGYLPYVDFIPQYGTMYSWLLYPFKNELSADSLVTLSLYMMNIGAIISIAIGVWLVYLAMNKRSLGLAILLVIPFTSVAQFPNRNVFSGTIHSLFTQIPIRLLPGIVLGYFLIKSLQNKNPNLTLTRLLLAFFSGSTLWLNQDFAILSGALVVLFLILFSRKFSRYVLITLSFILGLLSYPILLKLSGRNVNFSYVGFFVKQYESGFMAEPIITPGPILIVLPWIIALVCASFYLLLKERFFNIVISDDNRRAVITTAFFSSWTLIGSAYYLNRSYASGQMQILFLPLAVASASFFGYLLGSKSEIPRLKMKLLSWKFAGIKQNSSYALMALIMSLPLACVIAFPNPSIEHDRLTNAHSNNVWPKQILEVTIKEVLIGRDFAKKNNKTVSFFGASGNYIKIATGVDSANILNSPWDIPVSNAAVEVGCNRLFKIDSEILLLGEEGPSLFIFNESSLCNKYVMSPIEGIREFRSATKLK
jgi:hypothetical protein